MRYYTRSRLAWSNASSRSFQALLKPRWMRGHLPRLRRFGLCGRRLCLEYFDFGLRLTFSGLTFYLLGYINCVLSLKMILFS